MLSSFSAFKKKKNYDMVLKCVFDIIVRDEV